MPFGNVFEKINSEYYQLTSAEKKVADYVVIHQQKTQFMSISELAEESGVAEATISRFCRRLDYKGYNAFKLAVANSVTGQAAAGAAVSAALFAVSYTVPHGHLAFFGTELPEFLYNARWLFFAGFMPPGFYSADYFPLIPWLFLFWTGLFAWRIIGPKLADVPRIGACEWISRRTLLIYLLHQPVAYGILFVCFSL